MGGGDGITRSTPIGHRDRVTLDDRSTVDLNADTTILVVLSPHLRQVFLSKGEIRPTIHHDEARPLEILINHVVLRDLGTQFDVGIHETTTNVSVTSGLVQAFQLREDGSLVNPVTWTKSGPRRNPVFLVPGDSARLEEHDGIVIVSKTPNDLEAAQNRSSWLQDDFIVKRQRLDEVVWEYNRWNKTQIVIDDPEAARMEIGGIYRLTDVDAFLSNLRAALDIEALPIKGSESLPPSYVLRLTHKDAARGKHLR